MAWPPPSSAWESEAIDRAGEAPIRDVMLRLVDVTDDGQWVRRRVPAADIRPHLAPAVDALVDARIVQLDGGQVDVVHEVVFTAWPQLGRWLEEDESRARARPRAPP